MTLNSNLVGNLKEYYDDGYDTREEVEVKLGTLSDVLHRHEGDLSRIEALTMFIRYAPTFHVHMAEEILELKEVLDQYSDVEHTHPEFYLMVEVDAKWAALRSLLESTIGLRAEIVDELPETAREGTMYIVEKKTPEDDSIYDEYIYYHGEWELIDTGLEPLHILKNYATVEEVAEDLTTLSNLVHSHEEYITIGEFESQIVNKADNNLATAESAGLMSSEDYIKLESVEEGANYTPVDTELDKESSNCVENKAIAELYNSLNAKVNGANSSLDAIKAELEAIDNDIHDPNTEYGLRILIKRLSEAHAVLMEGVYDDGDSHPAFHVLPETADSSKFSFNTDNEEVVVMSYDGDNAPLFWTTQSRSAYASTANTNIPWNEFVITSKDQWWYSYQEINGVSESLGGLSESLTFSSITETQEQLKEQLTIMEKYAGLLDDFFTDFLIGYCVSETCTPDNCQPFTEWEDNIEFTLKEITAIKAVMSID